MKKIICLFALLFVSLFASANTIELSTPEFVNSTESCTINVENGTTVTSFEMLDGLKVCYTTTLTLLVDSFVSPVTGQEMEVYHVYTSTVCVTV